MNESNHQNKETKAEGAKLGISAATGAAAGGITHAAIGGAGIAALGTAFGIGLAGFIVMGAVLGAGTYLVYKGIKSITKIEGGKDK